jgi:hypothetical protein
VVGVGVAVALAALHLTHGTTTRVLGPQYPPLPQDERFVRILPPVVTSASGPHAFMHVKAGVPVRYDPCRPVHYVVNPAGGPPETMQVVQQAVTSISENTGLSFVSDGVTDETVGDDRRPVQAERYGNRWAPVLIGFAPAGTAGLTTEIAGLGGSAVVTTRQGARLVTGTITLNSDEYARLSSRGDQQEQTTILLHELGHVVGLAHVDDAGQLMWAQNRGQVLYGQGDLAGLAEAGRGPCFRDT